MSEPSTKLALFGGTPVRTKPYPHHVTTDVEEAEAATAVIKRGILSDFEGTNNEYFLGGPEVRALESEWAEKFEVKYAVAVNSATSGLFAAMGAIGIGPGDEVIVTPFTMTATAAAILVYNAVPVFADVDPETFNLDPGAVERAVTKSTKAIFPVHIFGHPAPMKELQDIARRHALHVVEDAAQSPGAKYHGRLTGTIGDIGVYSLNCNKHIQCGEGGIVVTNNDELAHRLRLIRNHAEAVVSAGMPVKSLVSMVGWNYRMTEIEAAVARQQLRKLDGLLAARLELVNYLNDKLADVAGVIRPVVKPGCDHVYYRYVLRLDRNHIKASATDMVRALTAEGMDFYVSYMKPLYRQPLYREQIAFGDRGCPFKCPWYEGTVNYNEGICPTAESLEREVISAEVVRPPQTKADMDEIAAALKKVADAAEQLVSPEEVTSR